MMMVYPMNTTMEAMMFMSSNGGSTTNNVEGCDTSEDSSSKGGIDNAFQRPRTRLRENSGIAVTSRVTRQRLSKRIKMMLSTNSGIAATVMVDLRFDMGIHCAKKSKSTFVRGNCPTPKTKKLDQTRFSHQKFKATLTLPSFMTIQPIEESGTVLRR